MASKKEMVVNYKNMEQGELLKIAVGQSEKGKYITLPLSYDLEFSPMDEEGKNIPISSITFCGTDAVIKTPASAALLELTISRLQDRSKLQDRSNVDPKGDPTTIDDPESGDHPGSGDFIDWIYKEAEAKNMDENVEKRFQDARRKIFFLQDEPVKGGDLKKLK